MPPKPAAPRRAPRQVRARLTRDAILEAAARILEGEGEAPRVFNTNRIAEMAGVSVGTLYQYFGNKQAILAALAHAETLAVRRRTEVLLQARAASPVRLAIRTIVGAFPDRPRTRRAAVQAYVEAADPKSLGRETDLTSALVSDGKGLDALDRYVISRAVLGAVRAAVLESHEALASQAFEDALVRLVRAYVAASAGSKPAAQPPSIRAARGAK